MSNPIPSVASMPVILAFFNLMRDSAVIYSGTRVVAANRAAHKRFGGQVASAETMPPAAETYSFKIGNTQYEARVYDA